MIDIKVSMYQDVSKGKDPDAYSRTLMEYHRNLWSRKLPNGKFFHLEISSSKPYYLTAKAGNTLFKCSSDCIFQTLSSYKSMNKFTSSLDINKIKDLINIGSTIGGYIIFPSSKIYGKATLNIIRGIHPSIRDRFDLTLECIRLWYDGKHSPLYEHLERYRSFFELFINFKEYVDFFYLNDLIDNKTGSVIFWLPFQSFNYYNVLPSNIKEYNNYLNNLLTFVNLRNIRIQTSINIC